MSPRTRISIAAAVIALIAIAALRFSWGSPVEAPRSVDATSSPQLADDPTTRSATGDAGRTAPVARTDAMDETVRVELPAGPEVGQGFDGRIVDDLGAPVDGAAVYLVEARQQDVFTTLLMRQSGLVVPPVARTETAADGTFRCGVRKIASGGYEVHIVSARHPDHVVTNLTAFHGRFVDLGEVRLPRGLTLTGTVTVLGSAGFPVPEAEVVVWPAGIVPSFGTPPGREDGIRATTGPNGSYRFENIAAGFVRIHAVAPGFARVERDVVEIRDDLENRVDFELPKGVSIAGITLDDSGRPIEGARVEASLLSSRTPFAAAARTDADGRFEVLGLVEGPYALSAVASGYVREERKPIRSSTVDQVFELRRQGSIALRVIAGGRTLTRFDAYLRGHDVERDALRMIPTAQVERVQPDDLGDDGRYRLRNIDPGSYVIQVDADGYCRTFSAPCTVDIDTQDVAVDVEMLSGGTLVGRCVGPDGRPVADVVVRTAPAFFDDSPLAMLIGDAIPNRVSRATATSGANGLFELPRLAPGDYQLRFEHAALAPQAWRDLVVADGERRDLGDIALVRGAELHGTVVLDGAPAGQVKVTVVAIADTDAAPLFQANAVTDGQGRFVFARRLPPGRFQVQAARQTLPNPILQVVDYQKTRREFSIAAGQESQQLHFTLTSD